MKGKIHLLLMFSLRLNNCKLFYLPSINTGIILNDIQSCCEGKQTAPQERLNYGRIFFKLNIHG